LADPQLDLKGLLLRGGKGKKGSEGRGEVLSTFSCGSTPMMISVTEGFSWRSFHGS